MKIVTSIVFGGMLFLAPACLRAQLINGSFENGLTGWTATDGEVAAVATTTNPGPGPADGALMARVGFLGGNGAVGNVGLDAFFGAPAGSLAALAGPFAGQAINGGSGLKQTFNAGSGGLVQYRWFYGGDDPFYHDTGFVVANGKYTLLAFNHSTYTSRAVGAAAVGPGQATLGFGTVNASDNVETSELYVDALFFTPAAEVIAVAEQAPQTAFTLAQAPISHVGSRLLWLRTRQEYGDDDQLADGRSLATLASNDFDPSPAFLMAGNDVTVTRGRTATDVPLSRPLSLQDRGDRWDVYAEGDFGFENRDDVGSSVGFNSNTQAATAGAEYRVTREITVGLAGSYLTSETHLNRSVGTIEADGEAGTIYANWHRGGLYADLLYSYGMFELEQRRTTPFAIAHSDPDAVTHTGEANLGYDWKFGKCVTGPFGGMTFTRANVDAYTETGAPGGNLAVPEQEADSLNTVLGWQASYFYKTPFGSLVPQIRLGWGREWLNDSRQITVTVPGPTPVSLAANTGSPQRDYFDLGAGARIVCSDMVWVGLDYDGHLAQSDGIAHLLSASVHMTF